MKINAYIMSLLPNFDKQRVLEEIRLTRQEIKDVTEPAYEAAGPFIGKITIKSKEVNDLAATFKRIVGAKGGNMAVYVHTSIPLILKNLDEVETLIEKVYTEEIAGNGLSFLKANLLQFVECASFVSRYARKLILYIYIHETAQFDNGGTKLSDSLSPFERQYVETNFVNFCQAFVAVSGNPANTRHALDNIPDIMIAGDNADTLGKTIGHQKIDPFNMGFIPVFLNPIFHVRMMVAEWQNARYRQAREELQLIQLRKLNLEQLQEQKPDAAVQKKIDALERRVQDATVKLAKLEKDHD